MIPQQIKAAIILTGDSQRKIARRLKVTDGAVTQVISGAATSRRIKEEIARVLGRTVKEVWPLKELVQGKDVIGMRNVNDRSKERNWSVPKTQRYSYAN